MELKNYFNYVQNVLGAKSFILPEDTSAQNALVSYQFAVPSLSSEAREILNNIIKALNPEKHHVLELKIDGLNTSSETLDANLPLTVSERAQNQSVLIIFGKSTARFLMPHTAIEVGDTLTIESSKILLTHSIEEMILRPELKRLAWQHLKAFVST